MGREVLVARSQGGEKGWAVALVPEGKVGP